MAVEGEFGDIDSSRGGLSTVHTLLVEPDLGASQKEHRYSNGSYCSNFRAGAPKTEHDGLMNTSSSHWLNLAAAVRVGDSHGSGRCQCQCWRECHCVTTVMLYSSGVAAQGSTYYYLIRGFFTLKFQPPTYHQVTDLPYRGFEPLSLIWGGGHRYGSSCPDLIILMSSHLTSATVVS